MSKAKEIWDRLSKIDVNDHTQQKNGFTYLSWTWAWATLQNHYPDSSYKFKTDLLHNGTCEVWVELTVEGITREMWLAVTDFRNKPVVNPTCDLIANARMRCLVKAIAMFGLGHYIYAGESLPMEGSQPEKPKPVLDESVVAQFESCSTVDELKEVWESLTSEQRQIYADTKNKTKARLS